MNRLERFTPYVPSEVLDELRDYLYKHGMGDFTFDVPQDTGYIQVKQLRQHLSIVFSKDDHTFLCKPDVPSYIHLNKQEGLVLHWTIGPAKFHRALEDGPAIMVYNKEDELVVHAFFVQDTEVPLEEVIKRVSPESRKEVLINYF